MRSWILLGTLAIMWVAGTSPTVATAEKPNILFILADDLGYGSLGCYGADERLVRTPNLDRLAREGRRFTDANTPSSVCSPTRYAVLTGRYCWRTSAKAGVLSTDAPLHIETTRPTLASLLKRYGYRTAAIGKWHLGYTNSRHKYLDELKPGPLEIGFDYHFGVPQNHGDITGVYVENHGVWGLRSTRLEPHGKMYYSDRPFWGIDAPQREDMKVMEMLTDKAVAWLTQHEGNEPFFLFFTPVAVHEPVTPSDVTRGRNGAGPYGDWIEDLDLSVGRLLETLEAMQVAENTLVIVSSDNGGHNKQSRDGTQLQAMAAGLKINGDWRGGKHSIYEGGMRVPLIVRWPGKVAAGSRCDETVNLVDCYATVAVLLGEPLPAAAEGAEDSYNVLPALLDLPHERPSRPDMIVHSASGTYAIRKGPWKYIEGEPFTGKAAPGEPLQPELYHLQNDPAERRNVIADYPEVARQLQRLLDQQRGTGHSRP